MRTEHRFLPRTTLLSHLTLGVSQSAEETIASSRDCFSHVRGNTVRFGENIRNHPVRGPRIKSEIRDYEGDTGWLYCPDLDSNFSSPKRLSDNVAIKRKARITCSLTRLRFFFLSLSPLFSSFTRSLAYREASARCGGVAKRGTA